MHFKAILQRNQEQKETTPAGNKGHLFIGKVQLRILISGAVRAKHTAGCELPSSNIAPFQQKRHRIIYILSTEGIYY